MSLRMNSGESARFWAGPEGPIRSSSGRWSWLPRRVSERPMLGGLTSSSICFPIRWSFWTWQWRISWDGPRMSSICTLSLSFMMTLWISWFSRGSHWTTFRLLIYSTRVFRLSIMSTRGIQTLSSILVQGLFIESIRRASNFNSIWTLELEILRGKLRRSSHPKVPRKWCF